MVSGISLQTAQFRIAKFYLVNGYGLSLNMQHLSSGKSVQAPRDNTGDYFRAGTIDSQNRGYARVKRDVGEALAFMNVVEDAGTRVFDGLTRMKELVQTYYDPTSDAEVQNAARLEFDVVKAQVNQIVTNTYYDNRRVIDDTSGSPLRKVNLDSNGYGTTLDITFDSGDVADTTGLDITIGEAAALAAVDAEMGKAGSYLGKSTGYMYGLQAQYNIAEVSMNQNEEVKAKLTNVDDAKEMAQMVNRSIAGQTAIAMLAQANLFRGSILSLMGN